MRRTSNQIRIGSHCFLGSRNRSVVASDSVFYPGILDTPPAIEWSHLSFINAAYANDETTNFLRPTFGGNPVSTINPITVTDTPADGTHFYTLVSEEYSKLTSEETSIIVRVVVSGGAITDIDFYDTTTAEWDTDPSPPTNFAVANKDANNHYVCTWTEPSDTNDNIVGYHIYYDSTSNPAATQAKRIATIPKGYATWKDWGAVLATKGKWGITSATKDGRESTILYDDTTTGAAGSGRPARPGGIPARTSSNFGLTELDTRRSRFAAATFTAATLENATTFEWQPETCMGYDPDTGFECWRMTNTNGKENYYHNDIGMSPWSANGAKMVVMGFDRYSQLYAGDQSAFNDWIMTVDTTGANMRPVNGKRRLAGNYFHWDPQVPNQYWEVGETHLGTGASTNQLSRTTVDADGVCTTNVVVTLSAGAAGSTINKMIWPSGLEMLLENTTTDMLYPITIDVDGTATQSDNDGYSMDRFYGNYGGHSGAAVTGFHDGYPGAPGWVFLMTNDTNGGTLTWWRQQVTGSDTDGGPLYTGNDGNDNFGEVWPENHQTVDVGSLFSPWVANPVTTYSSTKTGYWSHFCPDNWGRYALFSNVSDGTPAGAIGTGVWDVENHAWVVPSMGNMAQHHDWSGWCDSVVSSGNNGVNYAEDRLMCATYNDADSQYLIAYPHTRVLGGTVYQTLARPGQSPDGTKVSWHSEFLNAAEKPDIFWSVCYYPYAPTIIRASKSGGTVTIAFLPPKYTTRTWQGIPVYAREITKWRLLRGTQINAAAVVDLNGASGGVNATFTFTELDSPSYVVPNATITDVDGTTLTSLTIAGTSYGQDGANEQIEFGTAFFPANADKSDTYTLSGTTFALAYTAATKTLAITKSGGGTFTITVAQELLRLLVYWNQASPPDATTRTFTVVANDGVDDSAPATLTITVVPVVLSDSFTNTDNTTLTTHNSNWTQVNATYPVSVYRIVSNKCQHASTFQKGSAFYNAGASGRDRSQITIPTGSTVNSKRYVATRMNTNHFGVSAAFSANNGTNWTSISVSVDRVFHATKSGLSIPMNTDHTLQIVVSGSGTVGDPLIITVNVDGVSIGAITNYTGGAVPAGYSGFYTEECTVAADSVLDSWTNA